MIAICIGHSRAGDSGAVSVGGVSEHAFNSKLGRITWEILRSRCIDAVVIDHYVGGSYGSAMSWLAKHLRGIAATAAIELHFNSATPSARGHEYLYWHSSSRGKALARSLADSQQRAFPSSTPRRDRGTLAITTPRSRGGLFLRLTHCPAVIAEPFFGSNPEEWEHASMHFMEYAEALATGISEYHDNR